MRRNGVRILLLLGGLLGFAGTAGAASLDVPLTVGDSAGVARQSEPITFGVPLPQGLVNDVARLRLYAPNATPVPAAFRVVNRWRDDHSVQWVHADFLADVPARGKAIYHLRLADQMAPSPRRPLRVD